MKSDKELIKEGKIRELHTLIMNFSPSYFSNIQEPSVDSENFEYWIEKSKKLTMSLELLKQYFENENKNS